MGKAVSIFRRDLRRIFRSPVAALVVLGICVVPCLYAWINVLANWDPYENTSDIPVAVVNEDKSVELPGKGAICTGDLLVDALADNDKIGWQFVGADEALEGVRAGRYYAAIVIPDDFTRHLTGVLDGKTDKAHLRYYVNEKVNPIAPKVTDAGASTIESQIDSKFAAKVGEVVAEKIGGALDGLVGDSQGALARGATVLDEVNVSLADVDSKLGGLSSSLRDAQGALGGAADKLSPLEGLGSRVSGKLAGVRGRLGETRGSASDLMSDLNARLGSAAGSISSLSSRATYDISAVAGDIASAQAQVNAAIRTLESDLSDNEALETSLTRTRDRVVAIDPKDESVRQRRAEMERDLTAEIDVTAQLTDEQRAKLDELRGIAQRLEAAAEEVRGLSQSLDDRVQAATGPLRDTQASAVGGTLRQINDALDSFVQTAQRLETASQAVDPVITETVSLTRQLADAIGKTDEALGGTRSSVAGLAADVTALQGELSAIRASEAWSRARELVAADPESVNEFLSAPVDINEVALYPVENYASGVAPFFTSLALWVGGIALVAIFKLEVDEEEVGRVRPWQAYFGRWMLFVLIGVLQAIACVTGDLVIGIQCAHPWAFYLSAIVASFAFVNVIYALSAAFKHLGKALAFTLVILQVPGSAGTYPIEMMPPFFQAIGPWLPFTYSNNAMREAIGGMYGSNLAFNLAMLLLFVVPAILVGVTARGHLVNVNALFDRRLRETDHLAVSEPVAIEGNHYRLATVVKAYHMPQEYREEFDERSAAFERAYPALVRGGITVLFLLPLGLFALMLVLDAQLPTIACLVVALVAIYAFLIVVEYFHDRVAHKRALTELPQEELEQVLTDTLRDELMPFASIDAILERRAERQAIGVLGAIRQRVRPQAPTEQDPAEQAPAEQDPAEQDPAEQDPAEQDPAEKNATVPLATTEPSATDSQAAPAPADDSQPYAPEPPAGAEPEPVSEPPAEPEPAPAPEPSAAQPDEPERGGDAQ